MHLLIATRGYKPDVDRFITELQGKYFPKMINKVMNRINLSQIKE